MLERSWAKSFSGHIFTWINEHIFASLYSEKTNSRPNAPINVVGRIRNGVETIPSILRRKYHVDNMPVRGKLKTKVFFGFKMFALNFTKLWLYERGLEKCRPLLAETE